MLRKLRLFLDQRSDAATLMALVVAGLVFVLLLFPARDLPEPTLDAQRWYAPQEAYGTLDAYTPAQLRLYWTSELTLDLAFPVLYALLLGVAFTLALRWAGLMPRLEPMRLLGLGAALIDVIENLGIVAMVWSLASRPPLLARATGVVGGIKWALLGIAVIGLALVLVFGLVQRAAIAGWPSSARDWGRRLAPVGCAIRRSYLLRVPLLAAGVLLWIATLAWPDAEQSTLRSTIRGLVGTDGFGWLWLVSTLATFAATLCVFAAMMIWDQGRYRFASLVGGRVLRIDRVGAWHLLPAIALATPLLSALAANNSHGRMVATAATLTGGLSALAIVWLIESVRRSFLGSRPQAAAVRRLPRWVRAAGELLGDGYTMDGRLLPGHLLALLIVAALGITYVALYFLMWPHPPVGNEPAVAFVLMWHMLLLMFASGLSFFLDRYRVPLVAFVMIWFVGVSVLTDSDHRFNVELSDAAPVGLSAAFEARMERLQERHREMPRVLTVVAASGGGIQASAWATRVLTGLHQQICGFTDSIQLLSSVSGGSVGAYTFLEALSTGDLPCAGEPSPPAWDLAADCDDPLECALAEIRSASERSSLAAMSWGVVYPDFIRGISGLSDPRRDRGWALEQAWVAAARPLRWRLGRCLPDDTGCLDTPTRVADWRRGVAAGTLPAMILNSTVVESGRQMMLTPLAMGGVGATDRTLSDLVTPSSPFIDLHASTAARLSATFPYVSPAAAPCLTGERGCPPTRHMVDGAYYDNYGVATSLEWLQALITARASGDLGFDRIALIEIRAFPSDRKVPRPMSGYGASLAGPLRAFLAMRSTSQVVRNDFDVDLFERWLDQRLSPRTLGAGWPPIEMRSFVFAPTAAGAPMSWHLSPAEKQGVEDDWEVIVREAGLGLEACDAESSDPNPLLALRCFLAPR